ncbi:MAG: LytTR family transcriptional regulator [Lentimicrobiaceae bacterium]|nr:LytTR family transcriptional regulator [Lentimicrobiaceae bacterium]
MNEQSVKKKYSLRFGNKDLPAFLVTKANIIKLIFFTTIYSLVFINIFRPFNSETWIPGINNFNYFIYSSLMVLMGSLLISLSRVIMYYFVKKISIGYLEYLIWIFAEIFILASIYVFMAYRVGFIDNFLVENPNLTLWEAIFDILRKAIANTTWMLLIPYIISFLYLYNEHLIRDVINKKEEGAELCVINFKDERNEVRFTVASDKVLFVESSDNYCIIKYLNNDKINDFVIRNSLKKISADLAETPIQRCHRSYMINLEHVSSLRKENGELTMEFDMPEIKEIPISKSYTDKIMDSFVIYSKQNGLHKQ